MRASVLMALLLVGCASTTEALPSPTEPSEPTAASLPSPPPAPEPVHLVVDTDVAPDDLVAIAFLLAAPSVTLDAITITGAGEVRCEAGLRIVFGLLDRLDAPEIPVACGPETPVAGDHAFPPGFRENAERAAGLDLPASSRVPAESGAVELLHSAFEKGNGAELLTLGPLTNVALALMEDPTLADRIPLIWTMGGAVDVPGNVAGSPGIESDNTAAEWNIYVDPSAFAIVLDSGVPVRMVSLDGTNQVPVRPAFVDQVVAASGTSPWLDVLAELFAKNDYMTGGGYYLWDPLAALFAARYMPGNFTEAHLTVETAEGPTSGATRAGDGTPNGSYLTTVDAPSVEAMLLGVLAGE